ncbi:MAG TPA: DinB family protein [Thermoanaerobaculia bacterium]|nr:DinB family protein [Thermoanaerobaculia bacterium]
MPADAHLRDLTRHLEWADAAVWQTVLGSSAVSGDVNLAKTLHHVHLVQHIFSQAWVGVPFQVRDLADLPDAAALIAWGREAHTRIHAFLSAADPQEMERPLHLPWAAQFEQRANRPAQPLTIGDSVLQVALHTAHHRGQVCTRLRELGAEPPLVDFIAWAWSGKPEADWQCLNQKAEAKQP